MLYGVDFVSDSNKAPGLLFILAPKNVRIIGLLLDTTGAALMVVFNLAGVRHGESVVLILVSTLQIVRYCTLPYLNLAANLLPLAQHVTLLCFICLSIYVQTIFDRITSKATILSSRLL
jgi:hypothetical protein